MSATGDPIHDLWAPLGVIAAIGLVAGAWALGWLGEVSTAVILGAAVALVAFVLPLVAAEIALSSGVLRVLAAVVALGSLGVYAVLLGSQLFPGKPLAALAFDAQVREQTFELPEAGEVRVVLRTDMQHERGARLAWRLSLASGGERASLEGAFSRSTSSGRGSSVTAVHGALARLVTLREPGTVTARLGAWESPRGSLFVDVYANRCPHRVLLGLQVGLLLLALAARRRIGRVQARVLLVHGALFGLLVAWALPGELTPTEPVLPLFGTLVLSAIGGALGGEVLGWIVVARGPKPLKEPVKPA